MLLATCAVMMVNQLHAAGSASVALQQAAVLCVPAPSFAELSLALLDQPSGCSHCLGLLLTCIQVVPLQLLEEETTVWCREILRNSPTALRLLKSALNAAEDGHAGIQQLGGDATMLFYQSEEGNEGRTAYLEKRPPDFGRFPRLP